MSMLVEKNISLENNLKDSKELSQKSSSDNLIFFLCVDKKHSMIIVNVGSSTSHVSKFERNTLFVKPMNIKEVKANIVCLDKGKTSSLNNCLKPKSKTSSKKQTHAKFVPTCYHCGIIGHIILNYFQFKSQRLWKDSTTPKKEKCDIESCLPRSKSNYIPPHKRQHSQRFVPTYHHCGKVGHIQPNCFKLRPYMHYKSRPEIAQEWVKKDYIIHPLRGSGGNLTLI
jgi:hypothetical protein